MHDGDLDFERLRALAGFVSFGEEEVACDRNGDPVYLRETRKHHEPLHLTEVGWLAREVLRRRAADSFASEVDSGLVVTGPAPGIREHICRGPLETGRCVECGRQIFP